MVSYIMTFLTGAVTGVGVLYAYTYISRRVIAYKFTKWINASGVNVEKLGEENLRKMYEVYLESKGTAEIELHDHTGKNSKIGFLGRAKSK